MSITDNINFKNEVLRSLNQMKKELTEQINTNNSKNELLLKEMENKINNISEKNKLYQDSLAQQAIEIEKFKDFQTFKDKISTTIKSQENRIIDTKNQIYSMKNEYDRAFSENLSVPGYIGPKCKYRSIGDYLSSNIEIINKMKNTYSNINKDIAELKTKINNNLKHCTNLVVEFGIEQCKNFLNNKLNDYQKQLDFQINELTEKFMDMKVSFVQLKTETKEFENLIEKKMEIVEIVPTIKPDIETLISQKINDVNEKINSNDTNCCNLREKNYNELNEKITNNITEIENIKETIKELQNNKNINNNNNNKSNNLGNNDNDPQFLAEKNITNENKNNMRTLSPVKNFINKLKSDDIKLDLHTFANQDIMNKGVTEDYGSLKELQTHNSCSNSNNISVNNINEIDNILNKNIIENDENFINSTNLLLFKSKKENYLSPENNKFIPNSSKKIKRNNQKNTLNIEENLQNMPKKLSSFSPDIIKNRDNNGSFLSNPNDQNSSNFSMTAKKILLKDYYQKLKNKNFEYCKNETNNPINSKTMKNLGDNFKNFMFLYPEAQKNKKILENSNDFSESQLINNDNNEGVDFLYQTNLYNERSRNYNIINYKNNSEVAKKRKLQIKPFKIKSDNIVDNLYKNHYEKKIQKEQKNKNIINGPMKLTNAFGRTNYTPFSPNLTTKSISYK